jgi:hypothetical protein
MHRRTTCRLELIGDQRVEVDLRCKLRGNRAVDEGGDALRALARNLKLHLREQRR